MGFAGELSNNKKHLFLNMLEVNRKNPAWTMILLVVNVGSLETRCNQLKYQEQKSRSPKITAKLITGFQLFLSL